MTVSVPTLAIAALLLSASPLPESVLKTAIEDFEFGEHGAAAAKLSEILKPGVMESKENVIVARQYLGACYHLLGKTDQARTQFSMLLALDASHRLDPAVFSPALVKLFEKVRAETGLALKEPPRASPPPPPPAQVMPRPAPPQSPLPKVVQPAPPPHEPHSAALSLIPFGAGQFANKHPVRGALFAAAEVGLLTTAIVTFAKFESLKVERIDGVTGDRIDVRFLPKDVDTANRLQSIYLATFWTGMAVMAAGIVEALISYPGDDVAQAESLGEASTTQLGGAAAGAPFVFSF